MTDGYEMMPKAWSSIEEVSYCFSGSHGIYESPILTWIERFQIVTQI